MQTTAKHIRGLKEVDWDHLLYKNDTDTSAISCHNKFMEIMFACIPQ